MSKLRSPVIWLVQPLSRIHSVAFGSVPYSTVSRIGFTKTIVKCKHLTMKTFRECKFLGGYSRMIIKKSMDEINGKTIWTFYLASDKISQVPSIVFRTQCFSAGDLTLQERSALLNHPHLKVWL